MSDAAADWETLHPRLVRLAADGLSARAIARDLGVSRNAVLGRANREGVKIGETKARRPPRPMVKRGRSHRRPTDRAFRIAAIAEGILARSFPKAAKRLRVSVATISNWRRDPELLAAAEALAGQVRAKADQAAEEARRRAIVEDRERRERALLEAGPLLEQMTERERKMLTRRIMGETLPYIGDVFGVTRGRVEQIEKKWRARGLNVPGLKPMTAARIEKESRKAPRPRGPGRRQPGEISPERIAKAMRDFPFPWEKTP